MTAARLITAITGFLMLAKNSWRGGGRFTKIYYKNTKQKTKVEQISSLQDRM